MNRFLAASLLIGIVSGCGSSGSTVSPGPATTPGATRSAASVQPTVAPTGFPTGAFAALSDDPVPKAALANEFADATELVNQA